jgi:Mg-chelatase subunit ChlD
LRIRDGVEHRLGTTSASRLHSTPFDGAIAASLDVAGTIDAMVARAGVPQPADIRVLTRQRQTRNYIILVDHSGSMVGRKLELGATLAAILAELSTAGRADYAVLAFDEEVQQIKELGEERDVEDVIEQILRLPEGRSTDLGRALATAAEQTDILPEATDIILISDCMPTRGTTSFRGIADIVRQLPSLYICFTDERSPAIRMWGGTRQIDLYEWWARRWVGDDRFQDIGDIEDIALLIDVLSTEPGTGGP